MALCGIGFLLLPLASPLDAQSPAPPSLEEAALDRIIHRLEQVDEAVQKKVNALLAVVETEATAERLSEPVAGSLRAAARLILPPMNGDARTLLARARLPAGNEAVMRALDDVEGASLETQIQREKLISEATVEARLRAREFFFHARTPAEITPFIVLMARLKAEAQAHALAGRMNAEATTFGGLGEFFRALSAALDPGTKDPAVIGAVFERDGWPIGRVDIGLCPGDVERLKDKILEHWETPWVKARRSLEAALAEPKSSAEVYAALGRMEEANDFRREIFPGYRQEGIHPIYRTMAAMEAVLANPAASWIDQSITATREELRNLPWNEVPRFAEVKKALLKWKQQRADGRAKAAAENLESLLAKLRAVRQLSDLEALRSELDVPAPEHESPDSANGADRRERTLAGLLNQLASLGFAAKTGNFSFLNSQSAAEVGSGDPRIANAVVDLHHRLVRATLSRVLRAPELNETPLADQPIDAALDALRDGLASMGEWPRVLKILEIRNTPNFAGEIRPPDKAALASVRLFLAGRNFELAEQWQDAVSAYKTVLRNAAEGAPIKEAAERLKALKRLHPVQPVSLP